MATVAALWSASEVSSYLFPISPGNQNFLSGSMGELRSNHFHAGIDVKTGGVVGKPVYAIADGYVSRIKVSVGGYGYALYCYHPATGQTSVYAHLQKYNDQIATYVRQQQYANQSFEIELFPEKEKFSFKRGDILGLSGNSGSSGGPHLHFEIRDANQVALDPLRFGFSEIRDDISPVVKKLAIKTLDKDARVNNQFGTITLPISKQGNNYFVDTPVKVWGKIGLLTDAIDRQNGTYNQNGVPTLILKVDGKEHFAIVKEKIPFNRARDIYVYRDNALKMDGKGSFHKLYVDDGNRLEVYRHNGNKGVLDIRDTLVHTVEIELRDSYENATYLHLKLKGEKPVSNTTIMDKNFIPVRYSVIDNTLMFIGMRQGEASTQAEVFSNRTSYPVSPAYHINHYNVYLWDLRKGLPDSIDVCSEWIKPGIKAMVPSDQGFKYYNDYFDMNFSTSSLFDTLYLRYDYMDELGADEVFEIGSGDVPLKSYIDVLLKPRKSYRHMDKIAVYTTEDFEKYSYVGGEWSGAQFSFRTRDLGMFTLMADTIPPVVRMVEQSRNSIKCYIKDETSGVQKYEMRVNGAWVLMNYDYKSDLIWSERKDTSPLQGAVNLRVVDNVGNESVYEGMIP